MEWSIDMDNRSMKFDAQSRATAVQTFALTPSNLEALGLKDADVPEIENVAQRIQPNNPLTVAEFGRDVAEHASRYADGLLDQVRNNDLDEAGAKLTQVVNIARTLNMGALSDRRSRIPLVGPLIDKIKLRASNFASQFDTTREQMDKLIAEVEHTQSNIATRNAGLQDMFESVKEEHRMLGVHIAAGKVRLGQLRELAGEQRGKVGNDPARLQELADLDALIANLDKRIGDLTALQQSAMQSLPMIRMIQANNQMLVDKFHTIREITVPAWKRQFMLALSLNEQRSSVQLATTIDNTTNDLLRRNADLLHRNSVETAKANQRLVIDVDTLQKVQDTLITTVQDVLRIQNEGVAQRKQAEQQIEVMRRDLRAKLSRTKDAE
ncbi:toxic anion resistance protein [Burkholderia aenigmatica]|uniref:toxic anion resistance protein n=1 Tax=Burkholderia aenigmatica TaxID=2015348 RepID=UPI00264FB800|nr:toxic anion resistance protein [Burkholderia aenigmatica]MDN7880144.1 toxic anion resistance protein [Burkholderia aenigmatica]